jgi:nucleoside-diphosphate-sugar epimerase
MGQDRPVSGRRAWRVGVHWSLGGAVKFHKMRGRAAGFAPPTPKTPHPHGAIGLAEAFSPPSATIAKTARKGGSTVPAKLNLVTGATGLLGSHVAERLVARGERVRALVRPGGDVGFLRGLGVELLEGDLGEGESLDPAVAGASVVYHCAARVGDWGPWRLYRQAVVEATANLLEASRRAGVGRFLHVSSINVYGHPRLEEGQWLSERDPLGVNLWWWDHYCRAKILAEETVRSHPGAWTIVRPSWMFGPRDRNSLPRVLSAVREGRAVLVGSGHNRLNIVHAGDVADGVLLAADSPAAIHEAYNLSSEGAVSQREFLNALTDALGLPRIERRVPFGMAFTAGFLAELAGRVLGRSRPPTLTRYAVALIGRTTRFRIDKAREHLGWQPRLAPLDGLRQTLEWYFTRDQALPARVSGGRG